MRRIAFMVIAGLCLVVAGQAQSGLSLTAGTPFFITTATTVSIDGLVLTPSSNYTIAGANRLTRNAAVNNPSINPAINRAFLWTNPLPSFSGQIALYYTDGELNGLTETDLTLNMHNGTIWQAYSSGVTRNGVANVVTTAVTNVTPTELTLASFNTPLPLRWRQVTAYRQGAQKALIQWSASAVASTAFFEVERSLDGVRWNRIGALVTALNTSGEQFYQQQDLTITATKTYYRIKQVDHDGSFTYSAIVAVNAVGEAITLLLYPNPAYKEVLVTSGGASMQALTVYAANGQLVRHQSLTGVYNHRLSVQHLPAGSYSLQVRFTDGTTTTHSFIKQ